MEITLRYLQERAALYRQKAAKATKPADITRYRDFAELLDQQAAAFEKAAAKREPTGRFDSNC